MKKKSYWLTGEVCNPHCDMKSNTPFKETWCPSLVPCLPDRAIVKPPTCSIASRSSLWEVKNFRNEPLPRFSKQAKSGNLQTTFASIIASLARSTLSAFSSHAFTSSTIEPIKRRMEQIVKKKIIIAWFALRISPGTSNVQHLRLSA